MSRFCGRVALTAMLALSCLFAIGQANALPVEYVKVCSSYGAGFFYIPGTDTCIRLDRSVRFDYGVGASGTYTEQPAVGNRYGLRTPAYDIRQQACYGTVRSFARVGALPQNNNCIILNQGGTYQVYAPGQPPSSLHDAFVQWAGFHIGASAGYSWGSRDIFATETAGGVPFFDGNFGSRNVQGWFGGVQAGYDWQVNHWVYGWEVDAQGGSIHGMSREIVSPYVTAGNSITLRTNECIDFFSTVRLRAGYEWGPMMAYVTGGLAVAQIDTRLSMKDTFGFDARVKSESVQGGWAVGVGGEYRLAPNWSVKAEYVYMDFGDKFTTAEQFRGRTPAGSSINTTSRLDYQVVRAGFNYRFEGGGTSLFLTPTVR
jgi:outer membrane immunogenic protein